VDQFQAILNAVLPVFLVIGGGFALRRLDWLAPQADQSLLRLTINLLIPCLIFDSLLGNRAFRSADNVLVPPLVGFGSVAIGVAAAWVVGAWLPKRHPKTRSTFAFCTAMYNYGYVPIPLIMALFDRETLGVLFVHNLGVEIAFWTFGMFLLAGAGVRQSLRRLLNAPLATIVGTLCLNAVLAREQVPQFFLNAAHMLGQCAIPIGMLLIGATMADHIRSIGNRGGIGILGAAAALRLLALPAVFLAVAVLAPLSPQLRRVIAIQAAMPAAVFPIVLVRHYRGDTETALRIVLGTSALSLITIPLWIRIGLKLIGATPF